MKEEKENPTQGLKPYFNRMLCLQYKSSTSYFYRDYRQQAIEIKKRKKKDDILLNEPQSEVESQTNYFKQIELACKKGYNNSENKLVAELGKIVWFLYVEHGSLRKTLAALPEYYREVSDLKTVHGIISHYQQSIKDNLNMENVVYINLFH